MELRRTPEPHARDPTSMPTTDCIAAWTAEGAEVRESVGDGEGERAEDLREGEGEGVTVEDLKEGEGEGVRVEDLREGEGVRVGKGVASMEGLGVEEGWGGRTCLVEKGPMPPGVGAPAVRPSSETGSACAWV